MAPARITRSTNSSLPRKQYANDYAAYTESNAQSADIPSDDDDDDDEDIPSDPGPSIARPEAKKAPARTTGKRKQPIKPAAKGGKGMAPPAKRQRKRSALKSQAGHLDLEAGRFLWSTKYQTPLPEFPDPPPSLAAPSIADWQAFSQKVNSSHKKVQAEENTEGGKSLPSSGVSDDSAALAVLNAELAARATQNKAANKASRGVRVSSDRALKEQSVEWLYLEHHDESEEEQEEPAPSEPLLAHQRLERQRLAQQALAQQQSAQQSSLPEDDHAPTQPQEETPLDEQPLNDGELTPQLSPEAQRNQEFEAWVAQDLHVPDVSVARSTVPLEDPPIAAVRDDGYESEDEAYEEGPEAEEDAIEAGEIHPDDYQDGDTARSNDDGDDFDVDFSNHQTPKGFYDLGHSEDDSRSDRNEESLFVQDVPRSEAGHGEAGSEAELQGESPVKPQSKRRTKRQISPRAQPHAEFGKGRMYPKTRLHVDEDEQEVSQSEAEPGATKPQEDIERQNTGVDVEEDENDQNLGMDVDGEEEEQPPTSAKRRIGSAGRQRSPESPSSQRERPFVYIKPREDSFKTTIKSRHLETILRHMKTRTWTGEGPGWQAELLSGYNIHLSPRDREDINRERRKAGKGSLSSSGAKHPATMWYNAHRRELQSVKAREMLQAVFHLWRTCRNAPTEAQVAYFTDGAGQGFQRAMTSCNKYVKYICDRLPADEKNKLGWARGMRESLSYRLIPLLVLVLKEAFLMASPRSMDKRMKMDHVQLLPGQAHATEFQLQTLATILGWLKRLCSDMQSEFEVNAPDPHPSDWQTRKNQRFGAIQTLYTFNEAIHEAIQLRKETADEPSRKARAAENDRRTRQRKEVMEQKSREEQARQSQLFQASLQASMTQREDLSSSVPCVLSQPKKPRRKPLSGKEKYAVDNNGWYWDEDDMLLNTLKRVDRPNTRGLADSLPGRTREQVAARLMELRERGRAYYEGKRPGMAIPRWCEGYGWR